MPTQKTTLIEEDRALDEGHDGRNFDPSKNVLDLVRAESRRQDGLLAWLEKFETANAKAESRRQDELRIAETKRNDDLTSQRNEFENRMEMLRAEAAKQMAAMLSAQTDKSAILLSTTVDKLSTATNERLAAVEKNQYLGTGRSSVSDPATAEALTKMAEAIKTLTSSGDKSEGGATQRSDTWAKMVAIIASAAAVAAVVGLLIQMPGNKEPAQVVVDRPTVTAPAQ